MPKLPASAADAKPPIRHPMAQTPGDAYIVNPIAGQEKLTPIDALRAIGILAATLESDEIHHDVLINRKAPA